MENEDLRRTRSKGAEEYEGKRDEGGSEERRRGQREREEREEDDTLAMRKEWNSVKVCQTERYVQESSTKDPTPKDDATR